MTIKQLVMWLIGITRPVLAPLGLSTISRIINQILGIILYIVPAYALIDGSFSITSVLLIMVSLALAKAFLRYLEHYFGHLVAFKALELIRITVFRDIYPQAPAIFARTGKKAVGSGDILTRLTRDIGQIEVFFAHTTAPVISAIVVPLGVLGILLWVSPIHAGIAAAIFLGVFLVTLDRGVYTYALRVTNMRGVIAQHVTDSVGGVAEVTGYGAQGRRKAELHRLEKPLQQLMLQRSPVVGGKNGYVAASRMLVVLMLLPTSTPLALNVAMMFAVWRCWDMINEVTDLSNHLSQSLAAARRVWELSHAGMNVPDGTTEIEKSDAGMSVEWRDVTFSYASDDPTPAISHVSLTVPAKSWVTIAGTTGSGKSTIAKLLLRYWDTNEGKILLNGQDIRTLTLDSLRRACVFVTQDMKVMHATVAENLRLGNPTATDEELHHALYVACLDTEVNLDESVGEGGTALSGGQRQRLSLAQAVLHGGEVFVLDEFTAHLNPALVTEVRHRFQEAYPHATIIEIAHTLDHIDSSDWVAVMDQGRIVEQGQPHMLRENNGALTQLFNRKK